MWVRVDRIRRPLEAPYSGPFLVVRRGEKYFVVDVLGREQSISVDRLKPVHQSLSSDLTNDAEPSSDAVADTAPASDAVSGNDAESNSDTLPDTPSTDTMIRSSRSGRRITFRADPDYFYY